MSPGNYIMQYNIFYSWQSDTPSRSNKEFIREALEEAIATKKPTIEDWPSVESGMDRVPGTPEIATIMFEKIRKSSMFVADVTLVGMISASRPNRPAKRTANPNVLLEMGYAAGTIGWERIICVMNEHFGKREEQPVDVRNRRYPINYSLDPGENNNEAKRTSVKAGLVLDFQNAIEALELAEHAAIENAIDSLDAECMELMLKAGRQTWFSVPHPTDMRHFLNLLKTGAAVHRLIGFRLLQAKHAPDPENSNISYAYHWTYLGKLALVKLQIREHVDDYDRSTS